MKTKKGFILIECLIALFLLANCIQFVYSVVNLKSQVKEYERWEYEEFAF